MQGPIGAAGKVREDLGNLNIIVTMSRIGQGKLNIGIRDDLDRLRET